MIDISNPSGSHLPLLAEVMRISTGSVLELGAGYFSSPFLYWLCKADNREFVSYENDKKWVERLGKKITYIANWDDADILSRYWGVVLIDHAPGERRKIDAIKLANKTDYLILHDTEPEVSRYYSYDEVYPHFKYRYDYTKLKPNTSVLSNFKEFKYE